MLVIMTRVDKKVDFDKEKIIFTISITISDNQRLRWAGHVARMEEGRSAFKILIGKSTGKRPLARFRRR